MSDFNMQRLWLGKDGYYRDTNGNKIALKGLPLTGAAWKYLASKYGREYANRTSMNTRNGNIYLNGHWRFNDVKSSKEGRTATWDEANSRIEENARAAGAKRTEDGFYILRNPFSNKYEYVNWNKQNLANQRYKQALLSKEQKQEQEDDEFHWGDLNPFKKGAWEGNLDNAWNNAKESLGSIGEIWRNGLNRRSLMYDEYQPVMGLKQNTGFFARLGDFVGDVSRTGNAILGGTVGTAILLLLPLKVEKEVGKLGQWLDIGKDLNSIRSYLTPGEEGILPDDPRNRGFADKGFEWTGLDEHLRLNLNDDANFITAIVGTKGIKGGVSRVKSGIASAARDGVATTFKSNWRPIISHTPVAANVYQGVNSLNSMRKAFAPKSLGGASGVMNRTGNLGKGAFLGLMASDPIMSMYPYAHSGFMIGLNN